MNMANLIPWNRDRNVPSRRMDEPSPVLALHRRMDRMFNDFFEDLFGELDQPLPRRMGMGSSWPHVEVREAEKEYKIIAELPGMEDKDVDVTLREGVLTLKGKKKSETNGSSNGTFYSERWHGSFERSFDLGPDMDPDKVNAAFKNGILTVTIGKKPDAQSRVKRIPVLREG